MVKGMSYDGGMRNRSAVLALALLAASLPGIGETAPEFPPDQVRVYKTDPRGDLKLHVFLPKGWKPGDRRPAIIFFFGGGWVRGNPARFFPHSRHFANLGMVAVSADYRTKNSHGTDPFACIADGKSAIRWLRAHAKEMGIDPNRIVAAGDSAGGHVAASTALREGLEDSGEDLSVSSVPNALILFNPVIDTTERGYGAAKLGDRKLEASPVHHVRAGLPPTLILHGTADTTVPFENVQRFCRQMHQFGNRCKLIPYEGKQHGFFLYSRDRAIYRDTIRRADAFLRELGYLPK